MGLPEQYLERSPFDLSGGQKRKIALAGILAMEPDILVLDEPTAGLDPAARNNLFDLIRDYKQQSGTTVVFVSHSMEDVANLADRIVVMNKGKIAMEGAPEDIFKRADELISMGLSVPAITKIFLELKKKGYAFDPVYKVDDAVSLLKPLLGGEAK